MTQILRRFTAFVEGYDTRLAIEEITPPLVRDMVEEAKGGGLMAPIDVPFGFQKLEAGFKVNSRAKELMKQVGLTPGKHIKVTFRGVSISEIDGSQQDEVLVMRGRLNCDSNAWASNALSSTEFKLGTIIYYQHRVDSAVMYEIDLLNFVGIVDGTDQWAGIRSGLGL